MHTLLQDLRYSIRVLRKNAGFLFGALAALSLGIGANTAIFSVINTVLLQPLSYPDPDRIVHFVSRFPDGDGALVNAPEFAIWNGEKDIFKEAAAYDSPGPTLNVTGLFPEQVQGKHVTAGFFHLFGAQIILGRTFSAAEDSPNGGNWTVLSEGFWKRHFASDPHIVGKSILLGASPYTVVGVVSSRFQSEDSVDVYLPCQFDLNGVSQQDQFEAAARLRSGVTLQAAKARLQGAAAIYRQKMHLSDVRYGFSVESYRDSVIGDVRTSLLLLAGAVGMVLLIACANVANLLLARATGRQQELAVRAAVGASRGRIVRQLLTESVLLSLTGGAIGLALGLAGVRALLAFSSGDIPRIGLHGDGMVLDWKVLAFTFAISIGSGLIFGLVPALRFSRVDLQSVLRSKSARSTDRNHNRIRSLFVVGEMALAVTLVIGAALLLRTFIALRVVNLGFAKRDVTTMQMSIQGTKFEKAPLLGQMVQRVTEEVENLPGVEAIATASSAPTTGGFGMPLNVLGRAAASSGGRARWISISPHYFEALQIPVLRGRSFDRHDLQASPGVVIVNEAMAHKYWPDSDPLGSQIIIGKDVGPEFADRPRQVVGIVRNVHEDGPDQPPTPTVYLPMAQVPDSEIALNAAISPMFWMVRTRRTVPVDMALIEKKVTEASDGLPVGKIVPMATIVRDSTARTDFTTLLLAIFGVTALLLAAIGMYGVMAYSVEQKTQEIGIRMALGADGSNVRGLILTQGMRMTLAGALLGVTGAFWLSRFLVSFLFGVQSHDLIVFVTVPLFLSLVSLVAAWIPARRATRISPMEALRQF